MQSWTGLSSLEILRCLQERIVVADKELVANACLKIEDGDVILTYASSAIVFAILLEAYKVLFSCPTSIPLIFPTPSQKLWAGQPVCATETCASCLADLDAFCSSHPSGARANVMSGVTEWVCDRLQLALDDLPHPL